MPDLSPVGSSAVERCWQIMTGLHVASRVDAIEFLRAADCLPRLSIGEIRSLVEMFPLMPADQNGAGGPCTWTWPSGGVR
jgi:hypothetical protein